MTANGRAFDKREGGFMLDRSPAKIADDISRFMIATDHYGLTARTLGEQKFLVASCVIVIATALGICSLEGVETAAGRMAFASSGWLTLGLTLLCFYLAANYFFSYWCDRSSFSYRKHLALSEYGIENLLRHVDDASVPDDEVKQVLRSALVDAGVRSTRYKRYYQTFYFFLPLVFTVGALFMLVTQAPWSFGPIEHHCAGVLNSASP